MKKTFLLSILLGATMIVTQGCSKDDEGGDSNPIGDGDGDGDGDTSGDGDGDGDGTGDGDGDGDGAGDGDGDGDGAGDGDGDGDGDGTFVPPSDGAVAPTCDPFLQDCADGEKCVPYQSVGDTWDSNKCVEVTGSDTLGDQCTYDGAVAGTDSCDADHLCWDVQDVDGEALGVCTAFCGGNAQNPICDAGLSCLIANSGSINMCVPICDPLLQDCAEGQGCYWANTEFQCIFSTQDIPEGEPCGYINDCLKGNVCANADVLPACAGASCCAGWCDLNDPTCQIAGTGCEPWFAEGEAPPGLEDVGVCVIPGG